MSLSIEGPSKADIECHDNEDGSCMVTYRPTEPGSYIINVKFADKHVAGSYEIKRRKDEIFLVNLTEKLFFLGSPFTVNVDGHGSSRLRESITRERRAVDVTHVGSQCELSLKIPGISKYT